MKRPELPPHLAQDTREDWELLVNLSILIRAELERHIERGGHPDRFCDILTIALGQTRIGALRRRGVALMREPELTQLVEDYKTILEVNNEDPIWNQVLSH